MPGFGGVPNRFQQKSIITVIIFYKKLTFESRPYLNLPETLICTFKRYRNSKKIWENADC